MRLLWPEEGHCPWAAGDSQVKDVLAQPLPGQMTRGKLLHFFLYLIFFSSPTWKPLQDCQMD